MFECIKNLYKFVCTYKTYDTYVSVFKEISGVYYYENYHSDILAYYLKDRLVKETFINWLSECGQSDKIIINVDEYYDGEINREKNRIDIALYNHEKTKAIIIENKSNNAGDQFKQLYSYYSKLTDNNIKVDAIFYLNKNSNKSPDLSDLSEVQQKIIKNILVKGKLVGENSFTENVINSVIAKTNDIRLNGLSQEIRDLFYYVVYGDMNMENMEDFVLELSKDDNLKKLQKAIEAYHDIPVYLANKYMEYLDKKNTDFSIWFWKNNYIAIDVKKSNVNYTVDIVFTIEHINFTIFMRSGSSKYLKELKEKSGSNWIFNDNNKLFIINPISCEKKIKDTIDKIIDVLNCI